MGLEKGDFELLSFTQQIKQGSHISSRPLQNRTALASGTNSQRPSTTLSTSTVPNRNCLPSFTKQPVLSGNHFSTTTRLWPIRCSSSLLSAASSPWYVLSSSFPTLFDTCPAPKPCISHFVYPQTVPPRPPPTVVGLIAHTIPVNLPYDNTMLTILTDQWSHGSRRWP